MTPRERLARSAADLDPLKQGALDGLCGLYSIINAIALAVHPPPRPYRSSSRRDCSGQVSVG